MANHNLGLVSVSFRQNSPKEILSAMKKTPLTCIEWGSDIHAPCRDTEKLKELVKLQKEYGINCCSYGTYFRLGTDNLCELESYANAAKILGTTILRIWCGDKRAELYSKDEKKAFLKDSKKAADIAERYGVTLCMECHNNSYTETLDGALEIMKEVDSPNFQMYWQPNQFVTFDSNMAYAKAVSEYVKNIHVFNWQGHDKYPLCEAEKTWREYLSCFESDKTLLLEFMPDDDISSLQNEAKALCRIVQNQ